MFYKIYKMKTELKKYLKNQSFLFLLFFSFLSCSSIKVENLTKIDGNIKKIENVDIIAKKENILHHGKKIGDIVLKENPKLNKKFILDWNDLKNQMKDVAKSSGANLIEIHTIGYGIKGHFFIYREVYCIQKIFP